MPYRPLLDVIGDWWSLLIVRDALRGCAVLANSRKPRYRQNMLAGRLKMLVDEGILRLQPASDGSAWQEYVLTDKGRALQTVLVALSQWADDYLFDPDEPATRLIDRQQRQPLRKLVLQAADGRELAPADITIAIPLNN
nr:HxlR-like helix-turn-helix [Klebsiella pneumoniae]